MSVSGFEKFSVYGFSIDYSMVCRIEFNPKSRRNAGDIVFHFPDREKIFLSWGDLEKVQRKFHTVEEHAKHSVDLIGKSSQVKNLERVTQELLEINSHKAAYNHIKLDEMSRGLFGARKSATRQAFSLHIYCDNSSRYYLMYAFPSLNAPENFGDLVLQMMKSFKCH